MDEFGQRPPSDQDGSGQQQEKPLDVVPPTMHEVQKPPSSTLSTPGFDRRIAPFVDLPLHQEEKAEVNDGCCSKCIIM